MSKARVLLANSRAVDARDCLHLVVGRPRPPAPPLEAWLLLGEAHEELGEGQQAMLAYGEAVHAAEEAGGESDAVLVLAARRRRGMLLELGAGANALQAALQEYEAGLMRRATDADLWYHVGHVLLAGGDAARALRCFRTCCRLSPSHVLGLQGLGTALFGQGLVRSAIHRFAAVLDLDPTQALARQNLAAALGKLGMDRDSSFLGRASQAYTDLLAAAPRNADYLAKKLMLQAQLCEWRFLDADVELLMDLTQEQLSLQKRTSVSPFQALLLPLPLQLILRIHRAAMPAPIKKDETTRDPSVTTGTRMHGWTAPGILAEGMRVSLTSPAPTALSTAARRIVRVAFLSADLRNHPVGRDLKVMLSHLQEQPLLNHSRPHPSRAHLQLYAYALNALPPPPPPPPPPTGGGPQDETSGGQDWAWLAGVRAAVEGGGGGVRAVHGMREEEVARLMRGDEIHVLIDLMGHTRGNLRGVLAWQPCPVQVSYKGYMSTSGADRSLLRLLGDRLSTPPELQHGYSEPLVLMAGGSFISGHARNHARVLEETPFEARRVPAVDAALADLGIPPSDQLLCSFNGLYKIDQRSWDTWSAVLRETGHDVGAEALAMQANGSHASHVRRRWRLWLPKDPPEAEVRLCAEAEQRGVECDRLVFTPQVPFELHIQVKARCALALDTVRYNSHGTAADILWAGVPLVSAPDQTMASRLAASILESAGQPALIARNEDDVQALAVRLCQASGVRQKLARKLAAARATWALHDVASWARRFALALVLLLDLHLSPSRSQAPPKSSLEMAPGWNQAAEGRGEQSQGEGMVREMHVVMADEEASRFN